MRQTKAGSLASLVSTWSDKGRSAVASALPMVAVGQAVALVARAAAAQDAVASGASLDAAAALALSAVAADGRVQTEAQGPSCWDAADGRVQTEAQGPSCWDAMRQEAPCLAPSCPCLPSHAPSVRQM